jgi:Transposase DDE domain/Insertion element 4 transposase N-terminal
MQDPTPRNLDTALGDVCSFASIFGSIPYSAVSNVLSECAANSKRERDLPNWFVVYLTVSMSLFPESNYVELCERLTDSYKHIHGPSTPLATPSSGGVTQARQRLAWQVMKRLFESLSKPVATVSTPGAAYRGLLLRTIDGTTLDLPDTDDNAKEFGYPENGSGRGAYPQMRCVTLIENGSKIILDVEIGRGDKDSSELALAKPIVERSQAGTLLLADRLYPGKNLWDLAAQTGAQLLWRVKSDIRLDVEEVLPDGSYLSRFCADTHGKKHKRSNGTLVRVVKYKLLGSDEIYRLITTLLDPAIYPAEELARLYPERWDVETVNKELKIVLKQGRTVIRSKSPNMVRQEFYGLVLAYRAIRIVMHDAARHGNVHPDSISFQRTVSVVKSHVPMIGNFPP